MIIFGTRTLTSSQGGGVFNCPRCSMQRNYDHKKLTRWFTLYFIPCIPMGSAGEYVECTSCGGTYGGEVLNYHPEPVDQTETFAVLRRLAVLAMVRANRLQPENIDALRGALGDATGEFVDEVQIHEDARLAQQANAQIAPVFRDQAGDFTTEGKQYLLQITRQALAPQRAVDATERQILEQASDALAMPRHILDSIMSST